MKTNDLIASLASGAGPAQRLLIGRNLILVTVSSLITCSAISLAVGGLVPEAMWTGAALWTKLCYASALAVCGAFLMHGLAFSGKHATTAYRLPALVAFSMTLVGIISTLNIPSGARLPYLLGKTALICPWAIPLLSLPALWFLLHLMKRFAPTDLRSAGFATGLLAGGIAAAGYALSCQEQAIGFVAVWYSLGILLSASLGALTGPRLLRW